MDRMNLIVGAIAFLGATTVVSYLAIVRTGDASTTALGALIALVSAGAGYFLRGRVQSPAQEEGAAPPVPVVTIRDSGPTRVETPPAGVPKPPEPAGR